jgi:hypothetical protein
MYEKLPIFKRALELNVYVEEVAMRLYILSTQTTANES